MSAMAIQSQPVCYNFYVPTINSFLGAFELISDERKAGSCLWITNRRGMEYWPTPIEEAKYRLPISKSRRKVPFKASLNLQIPQSFEKV